MRFSTIVVSGVLAALSVSAQNITESVVSGTQSVAPVQATQSACLAACAATDPKCRDACIVDPVGVPNPAINCITNTCTQGNGTAAENLAFENCQKACRASAATVTATTDARPGVTSVAGASTTGGASAGGSASGSGSGTVAPTGSSSGGSAVSSGAVQTGGSATSAGAGSATTSGGAAATSSSAANAENVRFGMSVAGVFGVFAAMFAL